MSVNKMSNGGWYINFKPYGLFYILESENAILISYLFDIKLKRTLAYIPKDKILIVLDKLNINYNYLNTYHEFIINNIIEEVYHGR